MTVNTRSAADNTNPFNVKLENVTISKFNGADAMSIMPQVIEFTLYQSVFQPIIKADLVMSDFIGLMNNYPLSAEEIITVTMVQDTPTGDTTGAKRFKKVHRFVITAIKEINVSDDARQMLYVMELASEEAFINTKTKVSHAFYEDIEGMITRIYTDYIVGKGVVNIKPLKIFQDTNKVRKLVVPNLKPFDAIAWLCKFAISDNPEKYYTHAFYETFENFTFKTLQKPTFRGLEDSAAYVAAAREKYFYISNLEVIKNNKVAYETLIKNGFSETRSINSLKMNKRYSGLEKIVGGYFENEFVEVNMLSKDHKITKTEYKYGDPKFTTLNQKKGVGFHTKEYIEDIKNTYTDPETSPRVRYVINNFDSENQPSFRDKFGNSSRSFFAMQQVDLSISVPTNMELRPGDLIYVELPEFHSFNTNKTDEYLTGFFMTSEIKTVLRQGGKSQTYLRINRDSFEKNLALATTYKFDRPIGFTRPSNMGPR